MHLGRFDQCPWGWHSTLTYAAACGRREILRFIIDNPPDIWEETDVDLALVACAMADDVEYAARLLADGATPRNDFEEIDCAYHSMRSALRVACMRANVAMAGQAVA